MGIVIGTDIETQEPISIDDSIVKLSVYIPGATGMGKSTLLENIARQYMEQGGGLCFIDPKGSSAEALLASIPEHRKDDVIYWDAADLKCPFGLNPFEGDPSNPIVMNAVPQNFVMALESTKEFQEVFSTGVNMRDVLLRLAIAFVANQGHSILETAEFLGPNPEGKVFRETFYPNLERYNPYIFKTWKAFDAINNRKIQHEEVRSSLNKLRRFAVDSVMQGIFGQAENSINFRTAMDEGKIIIVRLANIGDYNAAFIGAFIVSSLWSAAQSRSNIPEKERRPFYLIADEFHTYMTATFEHMQERGRSFGLYSLVAHQNRSDLSDTTKGTTIGVKNKIVFGVSGKDAKELAAEFKRTVPEVGTRLPQILTYVPNAFNFLSTHAHPNPRVMETYPYVRNTLDAIFEMVQEFVQLHREFRDGLHSGALFSMRSQMKVFEPPPDSATIASIRNDFETALNDFLYQSMLRSGGQTIAVETLLDGNFSQHLNRAFKRLIEVCFPELQQVAYRILNNSKLYYQYPPDPLKRKIMMIEAIGFSDTIRNYLRRQVLLAKDYDIQAKFISLDWFDDELMEKTVFRFEPEAYKKEKLKIGDYAGEWWAWLHAYKLIDLFNDLQYAAGALAIEVWRDPIKAPSGQYEDITERQRTYSDVEAELANKLTTLPPYVAHVTFVRAGGAVEHTISTTVPYDPTPEDIARGEEIRAQSRKQYGRRNGSQPGQPEPVLLSDATLDRSEKETLKTEEEQPKPRKSLDDLLLRD